nr:GDCCVxC domain-containing (seleno)protein [Hyphomicrobium sp. GJ21]
MRRELGVTAMIKLQSTVTCPECGHQSAQTMPEDACQYIYVCERCGVQLKPKKGDCCVYCSYGDVPCPPVQQERTSSMSKE